MPTRCSCHPSDSPAEAPDAHLPDPASAAGRAEQTVGEIVRLCPEGLAVLQRLGIDHCCSAQLTLAQAAAAAGLDLESVVRALEGAGTAIPQAIAGLPLSRQVRLDVRDEIRQGREPFGRIMAAVNALDPGEALVLRAPFEPTPLFRVLARRGFASWIERRALDDCVVWFFRAGTESAPTIAAPTSPTADLATTLDVRGLEPPEPMTRVLVAIEQLAPGDRLVVEHDRRPLLLYPLLDERGFVHETTEPAPGLVRIVIARGPASP